MSGLLNIERGEPVYCMVSGWGQIEEVNENSVIVYFNKAKPQNKMQCFNKEGCRIGINQNMKTLWTAGEVPFESNR